MKNAKVRYIKSIKLLKYRNQSIDVIKMMLALPVSGLVEFGLLEFLVVTELGLWYRVNDKAHPKMFDSYNHSS